MTARSALLAVIPLRPTRVIALGATGPLDRARWATRLQPAGRALRASCCYLAEMQRGPEGSRGWGEPAGPRSSPPGRGRPVRAGLRVTDETTRAAAAGPGPEGRRGRAEKICRRRGARVRSIGALLILPFALPQPRTDATETDS